MAHFIRICEETFWDHWHILDENIAKSQYNIFIFFFYLSQGIVRHMLGVYRKTAPIYIT